MFKDEVVIHVASGRGGDGLVSFRREKYVPKGGPDGGDGGRGGNIVFSAEHQIASLGGFHNNQKFKAENGRPGGPSQRTGRNGEDLVLPVPPGTVVKDAERGHVLKDLSDSGEKFVFLNGGAGGKGNARFATSTNRTPRHAEKGGGGEERLILLELKMIAHVGIIGLPNAGKSTLLSRISKATPRIADYPFTTLTPQLGVVEIDFERLIFADIPGLIEGAHTGQGLGDQFLRHIERTRVLLHLIDCRAGDVPGIARAFRVVMKELAAYSPALASKPQVAAVSKADLLSGTIDTDAVEREIGVPVKLISAVSGKNLNELLGLLLRYIIEG